MGFKGSGSPDNVNSKTEGSSRHDTMKKESVCCLLVLDSVISNLYTAVDTPDEAA